MPHFWYKFHFRRHLWIFVWET